VDMASLIYVFGYKVIKEQDNHLSTSRMQIYTQRGKGYSNGLVTAQSR